MGWGQRAKSAQGTIVILMESDFSSYLNPCLSNIGGGRLSSSLRAQLNIGGGGAWALPEI